MTDKEKIRAEIERRIEELQPCNTRENLRAHGAIAGYYQILSFIDSMQEEPKFKTGDRIKPIDSCLGSPRTIVDICDSWYLTDQGTLDFEYEGNWELVEEPVSIWHDMSEEAENGRNTIIIDPKGFYGAVLRKGGSQLKNHNKERYVKWAYIDDIINITNKEEPVSDDLKTELNKYIKGHFTIDTEQLDKFGIEEKDYMYSMDKSDMLALVEHFTNWQKQNDSIVSEDLEEASKEWLIPQLDKSYANYGEGKMMELTHFDGYAMLDAIEFGAKWQKEKEYTCYEEAFEDGAKWQKAKDESTTEDLGEYINELSKQFPEVSFAKLSRIAVRVAKWQKQQDQSTIELAEDHAMLAGMEKMKEEMMKEPNLSGYVARDEDGKLHVFEVEPRRLEEKHQWWDRDYNCCIIDNNAFPALRWEDEPISVKLIIIKEE